MAEEVLLAEDWNRPGIGDRICVSYFRYKNVPNYTNIVVIFVKHRNKFAGK